MPGNALVGGLGSLNTDIPTKTVGSYWPYATTLFDYINRAMPYGNEKVLSASEVYSVTAYLLFLNDIIDFDTVMNAKTLPHVEMPNRKGFRTDKEFQFK
jgi:cytochrome c